MQQLLRINTERTERTGITASAPSLISAQLDERSEWSGVLSKASSRDTHHLRKQEEGITRERFIALKSILFSIDSGRVGSLHYWSGGYR